MTTEQLDLLETVYTNPTPLADRYRARIHDAIRLDAVLHGGQVDPNRVRARLVDATGDLVVDPRLLSAAYSGLRSRGVLVPDGWTTNTDTKGRNSGKPLRLYRYVEQGAAA